MIQNLITKRFVVLFLLFSSANEKIKFNKIIYSIENTVLINQNNLIKS